MALCAARAAEHSIQPRPHTWWESSKADVAMVRASPLSASKLGLERVSICGTATSTAAGKENSTQEVATRSPTGEAAGRARSLFEPTPSKGEGEKLRHPARHCLQKLPGLQRSQSLLQRIVRTNARIYALRDEPSKTYVTLKQSAANETGTSSYRHSKLGRRRIQGRLHGRGPHYRPEGTGNDKTGVALGERGRGQASMGEHVKRRSGHSWAGHRQCVALPGTTRTQRGELSSEGWGVTASRGGGKNGRTRSGQSRG